MTLERKVTLLLLQNLHNTDHYELLNRQEYNKINEKVNELTNEFLDEILN